MESKLNEDVVALKAHLALNVRSVATSVEFYRKMLGIEPSKVHSSGEVKSAPRAGLPSGCVAERLLRGGRERRRPIHSLPV